MNKIVFILILLLSFGMSCKKKPDNVISGKVIDISSSKSVTDVIVNLYYNEVSNGGYNPNFKFLQSTKTDADGNYKFEFESKMYSEFQINYNKDSYHTKNIRFYSEDISANYTKNAKMALESYLRVNLYCEPPGLNSKMRLRISGISLECDICCNGDWQTYSATNASFICPVIGGDTVTIQTMIGTNISNYKIYCPIKDTAFFNYSY